MADAKLTSDQIDDIVEVAYRIRLEDDCKTNVERMLTKDREADPEDNGKKLRNRSRSHRGVVIATLQAIGAIEPSAQLKYLLEKGLAGPMPK